MKISDAAKSRVGHKILKYPNSFYYHSKKKKEIYRIPNLKLNNCFLWIITRILSQDLWNDKQGICKGLQLIKLIKLKI